MTFIIALLIFFSFFIPRILVVFYAATQTVASSVIFDDLGLLVCLAGFFIFPRTFATYFFFTFYEMAPLEIIPQIIVSFAFIVDILRLVGLIGD